MRLIRTIALVAMALSGSLGAQPAYQVRDIAKGDESWAHLEVRNLRSSGRYAFFQGWTISTGWELYRSDGTAGGTQLVREIFPGSTGGLEFRGANGEPGEPLGAFPYRPELVDASGTLFFVADDGRTGFELWKSDGTPEGTVLVSDIASNASSTPRLLRSAGNRLFFVADGPEGTQLYVSDGTASGTVSLDSYQEGPCGGTAFQWTASAFGRFFYVACKGSTLRLSSTDGTREGTRLERLPGEGTNVVRIGATGKARFLETRDASGAALFVMDDQRSAPRRLLSGDLTTLFLGRDLLYFNRSGQLWRTDGSVEGTYSLGGSAYEAARVINEFFLFTKKTATRTELWRTDGTRTGTLFVTAVSKNIELFAATVLDGAVFFPANTNVYDENWIPSWELWRSDGTTEGTRLVKTVPGYWFPFAFPSDFAVASHRLLFRNGSGNSLWVSDGTASGTHQLGGAPTSRAAVGSRPKKVVDVEGTPYFLAEDPDHGQQLWKTDGTDAGTVRVTSPPSHPSSVAVAGRTVYFGDGVDLWRLPEGSPGAIRVEGIDPGPEGLFSDGSGVLFSTRVGEQQSRWNWWRADSKGAQRLREVYPYWAPSAGDGVASGGLSYLAMSGPEGAGLWRSDGTVRGSWLVKLLPRASVRHLKAVAGAILFVAIRDDYDSYQVELWRSEGTTESTNPVQTFRVSKSDLGGARLSTRLSVAGDVVYFAFDGRLWRSDGTTRGTRLIASPGSVEEVTPSGRLVFFRACDTASGCELWRSDGTTEGTFAVKDVNPGFHGSSPVGLCALPGGQVLFAAFTPETGYEPWVSDGTRAGTALVQDINPGPGSSLDEYSGPPFAVSGGHVYFSADDGETGFELWAIPLEGLYFPR